MPKVLLIGKDERIQDLKGLKDYLTKLIANSDKEGVKELVKRIETLELQEFLISWKKISIADEIKKAEDTKSALKILFKSMIDRDFPDGLIEENGCANLIGEDKGIDEILLMGGRVDLKAGNYVIKGDGFLLVDKDVEIIGDGRGRSNIRLDKDLEITNKARIKISHCTIRSDEGNERVIKIIGGEVEFEDINFVGVGVKIDGGCKGIFRGNLFEKIEKLDAAIDVINGTIDENDNRFEKIKNSISLPSLSKQVKYKVEKVYIFNDEEITAEMIIDENTKEIIGENGKKLTFKGNGSIVIKGENIVLRNLDIDSSGEDYVIKVYGKNILIENCKIKGGVLFENASGEINNCEIYGTKLKDKSGAIKSIKSKLYIKSNGIHNNYYNAISIDETSEVFIQKSEIYENGNAESDQPQIWVNNSNVRIEESKVYNGVNCTGIYIKGGSKAEVRGTEIYDNYFNGIDIKVKSNVFISNVDIHNNGNDKIIYPQLLIRESEVKIENSKIHNGVNCTGIYIGGGSKVEVRGTEIFENYKHGVDILEKSNVFISNADIHKNGNDGISIYESETEIQKSKIYNNSVHGIEIIKGSNVKIMISEIYSNNSYGIKTRKDSGEITLDNVKTYGNKNGGLAIPTNFAYKEIGCKFEDGVKTVDESCFITTATLDYVMQKFDDCYELNLFRWYRDNWLREQKDGEDLIKEYYRIAPVIVENINNRKDRDEIYEYIWENYLQKCKNLIENRHYEEAKKCYIDMVEYLKMRYLLNKGVI